MTSHDELVQLHEILRSLRCRPEDPPEFEARVFSGLETRTDPKEYYWDGRKRGGSEKNPYLVWQYTLGGQGAFRRGARGDFVALEAGTAFTTIVPSDDLYLLPPASPSWTFFWLIIDHSYVVERIRARQDAAGQIWQVPPNSVLIGRAIELYDSAKAASLPDEFAEEQLLFDFMIEYERLAHRLIYPPAPREQLLADIRAEVLSRLRRGPPTIEEIAKRRGMSRTHFNHHFREKTGLTPARFVTHVRIAEVARLLMNSDLKLSAIAELTGFADATHLGKVFRRQFHLTPDKYRHAMR